MPAIEPLGPMVRIRDLRLAHGLTLSDLAQRIREQGVDITESGISNVENARKRASDRLLIAWSRALGLNHLDAWQGPIRQPAVSAEDEPQASSEVEAA